jgi:hypothetical protein
MVDVPAPAGYEAARRPAQRGDAAHRDRRCSATPTIRPTRGYVDVAAELKRQAVERYASLLLGAAFDSLV